MKKEFLILIVGFLVFLYSCKGDCPNVEVKEVKWVTYQKVYTKTHYFVPKHKIKEFKVNYFSKDERSKVAFYIVNYDNKYPLEFKVKKKYSYRSKKGYDLNHFDTTEKQYSISPGFGKEVEFTNNCIGDYQSVIDLSLLDFKEVEQIKYDTVTYDSLIITKRMVNTCSENVEAINKETNRVIELYQQIGRIEPERMERDSIYNENKNIHKNVNNTKKAKGNANRPKGEQEKQ